MTHEGRKKPKQKGKVGTNMAALVANEGIRQEDTEGPKARAKSARGKGELKVEKKKESVPA